jgi:hypothetical protein
VWAISAGLAVRLHGIAGEREGAGELKWPAGRVSRLRGAGPAGLVLAHLLQREAIPFVVFERKPLAELCRHPKAGLIEYRTARLLEHEGLTLQSWTSRSRITGASSARRANRWWWSMPP